jgi:hypothetical protein
MEERARTERCVTGVQRENRSETEGRGQRLRETERGGCWRRGLARAEDTSSSATDSRLSLSASPNCGLQEAGDTTAAAAICVPESVMSTAPRRVRTPSPNKYFSEARPSTQAAAVDACWQLPACAVRPPASSAASRHHLAVSGRYRAQLQHDASTAWAVAVRASSCKRAAAKRTLSTGVA